MPAAKKTAPRKRAAAQKAPAKKADKTLTPWQQWTARPDAIDDLCAKVESGSTLTAFANGLGVETSTLTRWLDADLQRSARAREARSRAAATYDDMALRGIEEAADPFELARAKERAHHLRWRAAKVNPREYGEKIELGGEVGLKSMSEDQVKAEALALAAKLGVAIGGHGSTNDSGGLASSS